MQHAVVARINAIEPKTKATHIHLTFREMLDGCAVIHVTENLVAESCLQLTAGLVELLELHGREVVEVVAVRANEVGEDGTWNDGILSLETTDNLVDILLWVKAQAMHTCIELDMHRPTRNSLLFSSMDEGIHQAERVDLRLQVVVEHGLEGRHLRIHNHDVLRDAMMAKGDALVSNSNSEIVDAMVLQGLGHLHGTSTIGIGLDHADQLGLGFQEGAVVVEVVDDSVEVNLEDGLVNLLLQQFRDAVEAERTGTLDEDNLVVQRAEHIAGKQLVGGSEKVLGRKREDTFLTTNM